MNNTNTDTMITVKEEEPLSPGIEANPETKLLCHTKTLLPPDTTDITDDTGLDKNIGEQYEESGFYATIPPWEYIVYHSEASKAEFEKACVDHDETSMNLSIQRLESLINDLDNLLSAFKMLINSSCLTCPKGALALEKNSVDLSTNLSLLLGLNPAICSQILVKDPERINNEYERCCSAVDAMIEMTYYRESNESSMMIDTVSKIPVFKEENQWNPNVLLDPHDNDIEENALPNDYKIDNTVKKEELNRDDNIETQGNHSDSINSFVKKKKRKSANNNLNRQHETSEEIYQDIPSKGSPFVCHSCQKKFRHRRNLELHLSRRRCLRKNEQAEKEGMVKPELQPQFKKIEGMIHCIYPGCSEIFKSNFILYKHHQDEHLFGIECPYRCNYCEKSFFRQGLLSSHVKEQHEIKPKREVKPDRHQYKPVGYKPEFSISKDIYIEILSKGKPYACPSCSKKFLHRRNFESHLGSKIRCIGTPIDDIKPKFRKENGRIHCQWPGCSKDFQIMHSLHYHHQKSHLQGVNCPYKCDQCDKSFFMRGLLNTHFGNEHGNVRLRFCEICGKDVKCTSLLWHMKRHTGEKPHKCPYCEYRGFTNGAVTQHVKHVHETHRLALHVCDLCGKECKTKYHLKEHIMTHSDKNQYQCKMCSKYLKNGNSFRRHMVRVHKVSHQCDVCGVDYFTLQGLESHQLNVHNITC